MTDCYATDDSGERHYYDTGMMREPETGKPRYDLIDRQYLKRLALLMVRGAEKYSERNWELATTKEELDRFVSAGLRHHYDWIENLYRELDGSEPLDQEDHAVAVTFNVMAADFVKRKMLNEL